MPKRQVGNMDTLTALCTLEHGSRGQDTVGALGAPSLPQGPKDPCPCSDPAKGR